MGLDGGTREAGDVGVGDRGFGLHCFGQRPEPRSENHRDLRNDRGPRLHGADRIGD